MLSSPILSKECNCMPVLQNRAYLSLGWVGEINKMSALQCSGGKGRQ